MVGFARDDDQRQLGSTLMASGTSSSSGSTPLKRRRITRACDRCHRGGTKCSPGPTPDICGPCSAFGSECTYERPIKRRGPQAKSNSNDNGDNHQRASSSGASIPNSPISKEKDDHWVYQEVASHEQLEELIDSFYRLVYPTHLFFHWPSFTAAFRDRLYTRSRSFNCLIMSVCALASARLRDGAPKYCHLKYWDPSTSTSEIFYNSCLSSFPVDLIKAGEFDYKRTKVILSMLCLQYGEIARSIVHIGDYCTLCSLDGFQNESRWPKGLDEIEIQERRRLFWAAYQSDIYIATTFGGIIRHREAQSTVLYPTEVLSDDDITPNGIVERATTNKKSFLNGWNFVTNLYRILEHAVCQMRQRNQTYDGGNQIALLFSSKSSKGGKKFDPGPEEILSTVERLYNDLPDCLKEAKEMSGDVNKDIYGFQTANIMITLQLVKMVIAGMAEWSVEQRCAIAGELLDSLAALPKPFMQACGAPLIHHIAGVGHILANIIQSPLSPTSYLHVRTVLLRMADLLSSLESTLKSASVLCIAAKLRDHVERIDDYMISATEASGWNFTIGSVTSTTDDQIRTPTTYPPEPLMSMTRPNSSAQRSTQMINIQSHIPNIPQPAQPNTFPTDNNIQIIDSLLNQPAQSTTTVDQGDQQFQLPDDLFSDWSFMFNEFGSQGDAFDFLSASASAPAPTSGNADWQIPSVNGIAP
ncbi:hypothetical protein L486_05492 [Kwoniella mangroviensis CBS 10435]|uniref:Zn(2)-C6 fungal-type domain-containing protein n=1 Tax=Kwoniella mangroviensis CBS 10435 TaxID=1331196 RepID=A0A1B9IM00_9TREE|nr:hypothetical protein L486_05492 [Kwoniella mangroviensis CBS 10435]